MADDMGAPKILGLIGGILILIFSIIFGLLFTAVFAIGGLAVIGLAMMIWGIIDGILIIVGSLMMSNPQNAKTGAILVLIFGILGFFTPGTGGLIVGSILAIVGGAIGISRAGK